MSILSPMNSISGNFAIDLAIVGIALVVFLQFGFQLWRYSRNLSKSQEHACQLSNQLERKHERAHELREAFVEARAKTEAMLKPYLEDREHRLKVAALTSEREIDPEHAELEEQLRSAATKRPPLEH